jgi:hypothetical protein
MGAIMSILNKYYGYLINTIKGSEAVMHKDMRKTILNLPKSNNTATQNNKTRLATQAKALLALKWS